MSKHGHWLGTVLVFLVLPLALVGWFMDRALTAWEEHGRRAAQTELDRSLSELRRYDQTEVYLARLLHRSCVALEGRPDLSGGIRALQAALRKRFGPRFSYLVISRDGELMTTESTWAPGRAVAQRLAAFFSAPPDRPGTAPTHAEPSDWRVIQNVFGPTSSPETVRNSRERFEQVGHGLDRRWFFSFVGRRVLLLVHADHDGEWPYLALEDRVRRLNRKRAGERLQCGLSRGLVVPEYPPGLGVALARFRQTFVAEQTSSPETPAKALAPGRGPGFLFAFQPWRGTGFLWAALPRSAVPDHHRSRLLLFAVLAGGLLLGLRETWRTMLQGAPRRFPIRWRLAAIFLLTGGLPLAVIGFSSWEVLQQLNPTRRREVQAEAGQLLKSLDAGFERMLAQLGNELARRGRSWAFASAPDRSRAGRDLLEVWKRTRATDLVVIDREGGTVWECPTIGPEQARLRQASLPLAKSYLHSMGEGWEFGLLPGGLSKRTMAASIPGTIHNLFEIRLFGIQVFRWMMPVAGPSGRAEYLVMLLLTRKDLEDRYLARALPRLGRTSPGFTLVAADATDPARQVPLRASAVPHLLPVFLKTLQSGHSVRDTISLFDRTMVAVTHTPTYLVGRVLAALHDDGMIREEVRRGWRLLGLFLAICLVVGLFLADTLARRFLEPLGNLTAGVHAIEARNFAHRLPPSPGNELGDLAELMNSVLGGLADLEVARLVQTSLFPARTVTAGDVRLAGSSRPMSQLGGDYFDILPLPGGQVLFLLGDVSGHGVPAGLVMAMVKAVVGARIGEAGARGDPVDPADLLASIGHTVFECLKVRRMMTCLVGLLDPATSVVRGGTAGPPFPCRFRQGRADLVPLPPSLPLVQGRRERVGSFELVLDPGDRLLLYTDGFVETARADGNLVGYSWGFEQAVDLVSDDPQASCEAIFSAMTRWTAGHPPEDDVTLLLLCRSGGDR